MTTAHPTVLLVDDEKANLRLLSDLLRQDAGIILAQSGNQAIEKAVAMQPDLILLDILMPGMDGFDTLRALKSMPQTSDIPVIFITGLDNPQKEQEGLRLGAQDYIHKPFNIDVVKARIATQLEIVRSRRELQTLSEDLSRASEAKSRFLANMSHEIRTPLTSIIGYAEALLAGEFNGDEQQAIKAISVSGKHLLTLLNDVLDLSKIEAGKLEVELLPVNLAALLEEVQMLVADNARKKHLTFSMDLANNLPQGILTDPVRLKQILVNLLSNAIKFTPEGEVSLSVSQQGEKMCFTVRDTGPGIDKARQAELFAPFTQGDSSISREFGGTGLGLSISAQLAAKLSGHIHLDSTPGQGSSFSLYLQAQPCQIPGKYDAIGTNKGQLNGKVLLAEDSTESRQLLKRMLQSQGLLVKAVENGQQLLEAAMAEEFDLILSDISMPTMDGLQAIKLMRAVGVDTAVIALTANVMSQDIKVYLESGFTDHLSKPIDRQKFAKLLNTYLPNCQNVDELHMPGEEMQQLMQQFVRGLPAHLRAIQQAYQQNNIAQLEQLAHKLRGTAALFQFKQISEMARRLEHRLPIDKLPLALDDLSQEVEKLVADTDKLSAD
ncbi:response regulator [Bowmanella denitrificans]|uniref:response regulator n=1 Tax=Bowmanella denitrificans TaxID=366582 RepID=UPI000C9AEEBF|nr:response regulator [Bowmanella denitrificans]